MSLKQVLVALLLVIVIGLVAVFYLQKNPQTPTASGKSSILGLPFLPSLGSSKPPVSSNKTAAPSVGATTTVKQTPVGAREITKFVHENILKISPVKPAADGRFTVTRIAFLRDNRLGGTVEYNDGTKSYVADFTYTVDAAGKATLETFTVRK